MRIFVDLDGVLIDSTVSMMNRWLHHKITEADYPAEAGWNIVKAVNIVRHNQGRHPPLEAAQFWSDFGHEFWAARKPYPGAKAFVAALEQFGDVYFASSPTLDPGSSSGKHACIAEHFPRHLRRLFIGACKALLARPDAVLIDDADINCINFAIEGGKTILFPRPWNPRSNEAGERFPYTGIIEELEVICGSS